MEPSKTISVRISLATFIRLLAVVFVLFLLWVLRDIVLLLFLSMILAAAITPWINGLKRFKIPRPLGLLIVYSVIIAILVAVLLLLIPAITREASSIATRFPKYYDRIVDFLTSRGAVDSGALSAARENLPALTQGVFAGLKGVARGFASFLLVLVITFYFTVDEENLRRFWVRLAPVSYRDRLLRITNTVGERIGNWFHGQLVISVAIASVTYLVLTLLGIPDALLLSMIAGIASFVPIVGAIIGTLPAVFVALTVSVAKAIAVLIFSLALYQLVASVLVPKVMSRAVGLNPVVIILVMLLGAELAGAVGLILAIPIASIIDVVVREFERDVKDMNRPHAA